MSDFVKDLITKFTKYERYTTVLPGLFFVGLSQKLGLMDLSAQSIAEQLGLILFCGLLCSRVGAMIVEGVVSIRKLGIWTEYEDYLLLKQKDPKGAEMLTLNSNWFRSLSGMSILLLALAIAKFACNKFGIGGNAKMYCFLILLLIVFVESYVRQVRFMKKRVDHHKGTGKQQH